MGAKPTGLFRRIRDGRLMSGGFVSLREACELLGDIPASTLFDLVAERRIAAPCSGYGRVQFYRASIMGARESLAHKEKGRLARATL
jgi:hypothetical protein